MNPATGQKPATHPLNLRLGFKMAKRIDNMNAKIPAAKNGKLNDEMLALVSAIIKYIDEADIQEKKTKRS